MLESYIQSIKNNNAFYQKRFGSNVWVAVYNERILTYHIFKRKVNRENYARILRIELLLEDLPLQNDNDYIFDKMEHLSIKHKIQLTF